MLLVLSAVELEVGLRQKRLSTQHLILATYCRCCLFHHYIDLFAEVVDGLEMFATNLHLLGTWVYQNSQLGTQEQFGSDEWDQVEVEDVEG